MIAAIRSIVPFAAAAAVLMAILDIWIRAGPFDMARTTQVVLSIALLTVIGVLLWLVRRVEQDDAAS